MKEEFCLSDKINKSPNIKKFSGLLLVKDVREAVRLLKEEEKNDCYMLDVIDKIFGKELAGEELKK
jgi:hypothetical protein